jgi:hypothetical protein
MLEFWKLALDNLEVAGVGFAIFAMAYISNMSFSLYYNIKINQEVFSKEKLLNSVFKILAFAGGTIFLILATSLIVPWASNNGLAIPVEYSEVISTIATLGVCLSGALKYIMEAFNKMKKILTVKNEAQTVALSAKEKKDGT